MTLRFAVILAGCLSVCSAPARAETPAWQQNWDSIRKAAASIKTIETSFTQTRKLRILTRPLVSRGVMAYRRPNDLRWEYQSPLETLLVARAGNVQRLLKHDGVWVVDASAKLEAMKIVLGEINHWLDGDFSASRAFRPTLRPAQGDQPVRVELVPADPALGKIISRIDIVFAERPGMVDAIDIYEEGEGVTRIAFENTVLDRPIPDTRFQAPR